MANQNRSRRVFGNRTRVRLRTGIPGSSGGRISARLWQTGSWQPWQRGAARRDWRRRLSGKSVEQEPAGSGRDARLSRLEAILFLAREPLGSRKLAQFAGLADGTEARTLIRRLNRLYDQEGSAFRAEEVGGGFQLLSRPKFGNWLRRMHRLPVELRLSAPALESLAVVAYRQPVLRADIEAIRGVDCGEILRQLMDRDLVRIVGRSHELGRPYLYGTTKRFLRQFGLRHLDDLPRAEQLRARSAAAATLPDVLPHEDQTTQRFSTTVSEDEEEFPRDHDSPTRK